jgi:hypothetical protein
MARRDERGLDSARGMFAITATSNTQLERSTCIACMLGSLVKKR